MVCPERQILLYTSRESMGRANTAVEFILLFRAQAKLTSPRVPARRFLS
jgi:hypothetical protein